MMMMMMQATVCETSFCLAKS